MNATDFVKLVEAKLGFEVKAPRGAPAGSYAGYIREASKVKKKIETNPALYTWDNLKLAVELLAREKISRTPVGVLAHVDRALDLALDPEVDVEEEIRQATAIEVAKGDPHGWSVRFARAVGQYREAALQEWKDTRG